ncbi:nuclear transport factor 2 family protein [Streptomyces sp. NPDC006798]|uniref:nuclear transport factor 2 family protein n=1 Tax=Streptomyces sp. NPDC006798 TaxID=3155462 RepID=UPI0033D1E405
MTPGPGAGGADGSPDDGPGNGPGDGPERREQGPSGQPGPALSQEAADIAAVTAANTAFYEAVERGDAEAMDELWLLDDGVSCVHPGWPVLSGRGEVLRSYALIMAHTEYIQFFLTDVRVEIAAGTAVVTCTENILSSDPAEPADAPGALVGAHVVATTVFRRTGDDWRIWSHHGSPVLTDDAPGGSGDGPASG